MKKNKQHSNHKMQLISRRSMLAKAVAYAGAPYILSQQSYAQEKIKVAFVFLGSAQDNGRNASHFLGLEQLRIAMGDQIDIIMAENLSPETAQDGMQSLVMQGAKLLFVTDPSLSQVTKSIAKDHPDIHFEQLGIGWHPSDETVNISNFASRSYQGQFIFGVLAGLLTKTHKIGFIAATPSPRSLLDINAFALGARQSHPQNKVFAKWVGAWQDPELEAHVAENLIQQDCDFLGQQTGSDAANTIAIRKEVFCFGMELDRNIDNNPWLISSLVSHWGNYYIRRTLDQLRGKWTSEFNWSGLDTGVVRITDFNSSLAQDYINKIDDIRTAIIKGEQLVFTGPAFDSSGASVIANDSALSDSQLLEMDWINDNVVTDQG